MNAIELKAIVNYLIESYCDNVNGDFRYTIKEKSVGLYCFNDKIGDKSRLQCEIYYDSIIKPGGYAKQECEIFHWDGSEKLTMLETYVNEALDRIYKAELIDLRKDDPTVG